MTYKTYLKVLLFYFQLHDDFNNLVMNLIIADFITAGYGVPVDFVASLLYGWKLGKNMCLFTGFLLTLSGESSIFGPYDILSKLYINNYKYI